MKKILVILGVCAMLATAACSSGGSKNSAQDTTPALNQTGADNQNPTDTMGANADSKPTVSKGKDLMAALDCSTCHREHDKLVGPAFAAIASKYPSNDKNIDYLADKIIKGGSGVWGDVAMTPHPTVAKDDAQEIAKYILTIK
jgi:cytochrome c